MSIKQNGGVFGRNPTFNDVTIEGQLTFDGDIDINSDLKVDGDIETTGNVIIATSGKGIDFSATAGTGTSELLSDYEQGNWTPTYAITGGSFSALTYNTYTGGVYTKVGNVIYVSGYITTNSASVSVDGPLIIEGLPFATGSGTGLSTRSAVTIGDVSAFGTNYPTSGRFQAGTSRIYLTERSSANGVSTFLQASNMGNTTQDNQISFSGFYMI